MSDLKNEIEYSKLKKLNIPDLKEVDFTDPIIRSFTYWAWFIDKQSLEQIFNKVNEVYPDYFTNPSQTRRYIINNILQVFRRSENKLIVKFVETLM